MCKRPAAGPAMYARFVGAGASGYQREDPRMTEPEQLSLPGMDPRRQAAITAKLLEMALDKMYDDQETE
jgi:hypothetical protein